MALSPVPQTSPLPRSAVDPCSLGRCEAMRSDAAPRHGRVRHVKMTNPPVRALAERNTGDAGGRELLAGTWGVALLVLWEWLMFRQLKWGKEPTCRTWD